MYPEGTCDWNAIFLSKSVDFMRGLIIAGAELQVLWVFLSKRQRLIVQVSKPKLVIPLKRL